MKSLIYFVVVVVLLWIGYGLLTFTVDETQKAVVLQFGKIVRIVEEPGLYFKTPFIQQVLYLEDRLMSYELTTPEPITTADKQRLTMDSYVLWRIRDPQAFVKRFHGQRVNAEDQLIRAIRDALRDVVAEQPFQEVLKRDFLNDVKQQAQSEVESYGIEIEDVRIKRADLPEDNERAVYDRMISERRRDAQRYRAEGEQEAQRIRSEADRKVQIILAEARKRAEELKGEGDATALEIYAEAYNKDPNFFLFWRTLESYKRSLAKNGTLVLSTSSDYLKLLDIMESKRLIEALDGR